MKASHAAAAMALASWYLLIPPIQDGKKLLDHAALSQWQVAATLDSAEDCAAKKQEFTNQANQLIVDPSASVKLVARAQLAATCVKSSDPRLHSALPTF